MSVDARPGPLSDCFDATGDESQYNLSDIPSHHVKAWSFSNVNWANPQPIPLRADSGCFRPPDIDGSACFLVLHVSRKDGSGVSKSASEVRSFAEQASALITPRGLRIPVSSVIEQSGQGQEWNYCIFVWNGVKADKKLKVRVLTTAFELNNHLKEQGNQLAGLCSRGVELKEPVTYSRQRNDSIESCQPIKLLDGLGIQTSKKSKSMFPNLGDAIVSAAANSHKFAPEPRVGPNGTNGKNSHLGSAINSACDSVGNGSGNNSSKKVPEMKRLPLGQLQPQGGLAAGSSPTPGAKKSAKASAPPPVAKSRAQASGTLDSSRSKQDSSRSNGSSALLSSKKSSAPSTARDHPDSKRRKSRDSTGSVSAKSTPKSTPNATGVVPKVSAVPKIGIPKIGIPKIPSMSKADDYAPERKSKAEKDKSKAKGARKSSKDSGKGAGKSDGYAGRKESEVEKPAPKVPGLGLGLNLAGVASGDKVAEPSKKPVGIASLDLTQTMGTKEMVDERNERNQKRKNQLKTIQLPNIS